MTRLIGGPNIKPPPLSEIRARIAALKRVNLNTVEVDFLKQRLSLLFHAYTVSSPFLSVGQQLHRGVIWRQRPDFVHQLSYPPAALLNSYGRANRPSQSMFYASVSRESPFFELEVKAGDLVALSRWRVTKKILVNSVGYATNTSVRFGATRLASPSWLTTSKETQTLSNRIRHEYFAEEFCRHPISSPHEYKLSVAITERLLGKLDDLENYRDAPSQEEFAGVVYPSLAMKANSDNLVLLPHFVDRALAIERVEYILVEDVLNFSYRVRELDVATNFEEDGRIRWRGRPANWTIEPKRSLMLMVENGRWVARDERNNIVEPS
jgi:hypothetical protein